MPVVIICKFTIWTTLTRSDTANSYQKEESEIWIGEWLAKRGMSLSSGGSESVC